MALGTMHKEENASMSDKKDVLALLKDCGAKDLGLTARGHMKWRLPNGKLFTTSSTPSSYCTMTNAYAALRREIRETHPEIADRDRVLPKNKRYNSTTLGEISALKGFDLHNGNGHHIEASAAIPGSQPIPLPEAEFEILAPEQPLSAQSTLDAPPSYHPPRKPIERKEPPPAPRTLSPAQLEVANYLLKTEGQAAMDTYINNTRADRVQVTPEIIAERTRSANPIATENDPMSDLATRARKELDDVKQRLATYPDKIKALTEAQDADTARELILQQYIESYEKMEREAKDVLGILPPEPPKPQPVMIAAKAKDTKLRTLTFTMKDVHRQMYPLLRALKRPFGTDDIMAAYRKSGLPEPEPNPTQIASWFGLELRKGDASEIERSGERGYYRFKQTAEPVVPATPHPLVVAVPASQVHHV